MTIVAAKLDKDGCIFGCDQGVSSSGIFVEHLKRPKYFENGRFVIGFAGAISDVQKLGKIMSALNITNVNDIADSVYGMRSEHDERGETMPDIVVLAYDRVEHQLYIVNGCSALLGPYDHAAIGSASHIAWPVLNVLEGRKVKPQEVIGLALDQCEAHGTSIKGPMMIKHFAHFRGADDDDK